MSSPKITVSTELMQNYKQALVMSPEKQFEALQTAKGNSLLFSIGTDGVFYVTEETVEHSTGWQKTDLSSAQIAKSFPGRTDVTCEAFAAAQSAVDGTIGLAIIVTDGTGDQLFLCLGNSSSDTGWIQSPAWTQYPFDNPPKAVTIVGVLLSGTAENAQYIVADILRDPASAEQLISRYYLDPQSTPVWQPHDVAIDLEANSYTSCLGRQYLQNSPHQPTIDGLYTAGQVDGSAQLTFQPLYNVFDPGAPAPVARLSLPGGVITDTIASCRKPDLSTDLYACAAGGLYYFASSNQEDGAVAVLLAQNAIFTGVRMMYAAQANGTSIVWGLNGNDEVFYTSCPAGRETATPSAWSYPLPICTEVDLLSPYINLVDDGNTFFAVAGDTLQKLCKASGNTIWSSQSITLPSPNVTDTQQYSSYTTRIQVSDENNQPLIGVPVTISANMRTPVYINHLYYVVDPSGIEILTDVLGSVTVIQWITDLTGAKLTVTDGSGQATAVNPMDGPMAQIAQLNSVGSLQAATITEDDGSTRPLVSSAASAADLQAVATANGQLGNVYSTLSPAAGTSLVQLPAAPAATQLSALDALWVDAGDLVRWLASGVEAVIQIVEDAGAHVWHFIATVAGKIYAAVLDAAEKVVAAATAVFNMIDTAVEDLIQFLQYLFDFQDILMTHRVMKNVLTQWVTSVIDGAGNMGPGITAAFTALQNNIDQWANIPAFPQTPSSTSAGNPPLPGQNGAPAQLGIHHYQGGAAAASSAYEGPSVDASLFQDLINLLDSEEATFSAAVDAIKTQIIDQFDSLTITQIVQRFAAIVSDTLLQAAEDVLLAACNVFSQLAQSFLGVLTATIDIPVLSWLYKKLTGDDLSFMDLFCFIAAIPATIVYKIANRLAPFSAGDPFTNGLLSAQNFDQVRSQFYTTASSPAASADPAVPVVMEADPVIDDKRLQQFSLLTGFVAYAGALGSVVVMAFQRDMPDNAPTKPKVTWAALYALANVAYVSPNILTAINIGVHAWWQLMNDILTGLSIGKGFASIPMVKCDCWQKVNPVLEFAFNVAWMLPVGANLAVNSYPSLAVETIGNIAFNLGGMDELAIAICAPGELRTALAMVQAILMGVYGALMVATGAINNANA